MARYCCRRCDRIASGVHAMTRIVITAGHGGKDPGAVYNGIKEADFCADMRLSLIHI